jgi:7SK snRNA methylphosphate capping enzyme
VCLPPTPCTAPLHASQVLSPEWVKGADCLDIGCNEGLVTLALVTQLQARSAVGVDIDRALIAKACEHLQRVHHETSEELREAIHAR